MRLRDEVKCPPKLGAFGGFGSKSRRFSWFYSFVSFRWLRYDRVTMDTAASSARVELLLFWPLGFLFLEPRGPVKWKLSGRLAAPFSFGCVRSPVDRKPGPVDAKMTRLGTDEWRNNQKQTVFLATWKRVHWRWRSGPPTRGIASKQEKQSNEKEETGQQIPHANYIIPRNQPWISGSTWTNIRKPMVSLRVTKSSHRGVVHSKKSSYTPQKNPKNPKKNPKNPRNFLRI